MMNIEEQARLKAILENAVDAIITIDEFGTIEVINPATETMFGYSAEELIGQNIKILMPAPYREEHDGYLHAYRHTHVRKIIGIGREVTGRRKNGSEFAMHLAVSEFTSGERRLFTGIVRDISDLKIAEEELKRLNSELETRVQQRTAELREAQSELVKREKLATLGQVSGGIAHEIRNPLNAVKTSAYYLLNAKNASPEKVREHLQRIDRQVTLIDNVVTALSDVARMPEPKRTPQDVCKQLRVVVNSVNLGDEIEVEMEFPEEPIFVQVDEHQMPIVFRNLVRNARDAMSDSGKLTVGVRRQDDGVVAYVEDTGIGIADELLQQIVEPLFSTKARGMGLGLAISQAIVQKNGARLEVESEVGKGSRFSVHFANT